MCVAQRERSASAARAQRERAQRKELSAPAPAHEGASTQKPAARAAELGAACPARSRGVRSCMQAHAERGARDGEARRRRPSACGRLPANHARMARHKGGREIHHHPTSLHAGVYVRAQHAAAGGPPRATEPASSEQARRVRSGPSRELRGTAPEGREGRSAATSPPPAHETFLAAGITHGLTEDVSFISRGI